MIVDLPSTTTSAVGKKLVRLRNDVGAMALGRVLTLVVVVDEDHADTAIEAANDASRQHPCRIITIVAGNKRGANRLDAQIRVGGDAGASEVVVLRMYGALAGHGQSVALPLLLPDSPVVAWWPNEAPVDVAADPMGRLAQRRITDSAEARNPHRELLRRAQSYSPGDTDLSWTRITLWRGLLAAALDQPPYEPVTSATVSGASDSASTDLLAGWLVQTLRCPVTRTKTRAGTGMSGVRLDRRSGAVDLERPDGAVASLTQPGQPVRRISLARRHLAECLADELRRLDPDEIYGEALTKGMPKVGAKRSTPGSTPAPSSAAASASASASDEAGEAAAAQEPATKEPATKEPATKEPATKEPATKEPATKEPATKEPA